MPALNATPIRPIQAARFIVRVEGAPGVAMTAKFKTCSELSAEIAKSEIWHGGSMIAQKEPARVTFPDITLERGATDDGQLFNWFAQSAAPTPSIGGIGQAFKRQVDIVEQDRARITINRWRLVNCWVSGYKAGDWDNESDDFLFESVTLAFEFFLPIGLAGAVAIDQISAALG